MVLHYDVCIFIFFYFLYVSGLKQILCNYIIGSKFFFLVYEKLVALKRLLSSVLNKGYVIKPCITSLK